MLIKSDQPCPCGDGSTSYAIYDDGGHCFKCNKTFKEDGTIENEAQDVGRSNAAQTRYTKQFLSYGGIEKRTLEKLNCPAMIAENGEPYAVSFPYGEAQSWRILNPGNGPKYRFQGDSSKAKPAFMEHFPAGSSKAITIYEGAKDAASGIEIMGWYPSIGVRSASSALKEIQSIHEYVNSFEKIVLCFDNDKAGREAAQKVAKLFNFDKVYNVTLPYENGAKVDVNDLLTSNRRKEFTSMWWNAKKFVPEGIVATNQEVWEIMQSRPLEALCAYPWPTLQAMTYGMFSGQFNIIKAPTKVGKTEFISHMEYKVLKDTDYNIGVIHIEDRKDITPKRYSTYELGRTAHLPDSFATNEELFDAYKRAVGRDGRVYYYSHFGSKDPEVILDTIRYLVTVCGCRFIFLDHITMVISGLGEKDERQALDKIATSLATMTNDLDFCCQAITHVNDNGQSRGSRTIEHTAHTLINLKRNKEAESELERNTLLVSLEGNRISGLTGPAGQLIFDRETWRLNEFNPEEGAVMALQR